MTNVVFSGKSVDSNIDVQNATGHTQPLGAGISFCQTPSTTELYKLGCSPIDEAVVEKSSFKLSK